MANIIKEILEHLPKGKISFAGFEGAKIVLYTKDKEFFKNDKGTVKKAVNEFKKRIELRCDPAITKDAEDTKDFINKNLPDEADVSQILFEPQRSIVIIEVGKPGAAIGRNGSNLKLIKDKTCWTPKVRRKPAIRSPLIEDIRSVLYENNDEIKKFLNSVGERIYNGWVRGRKDEWVRTTFLGGAKQIGRSSILLQTPESRVLLDCGIDPALSADDSNSYPIFDAPEFDLNELDAVIVTHAHLDHSGMIPYLFRMGYRGPVYCTEPTRDIMSLLQLDSIKIVRGEGNKPLFSSDDIKEMVKHTITLDYKKVTDITPDIRITLYNAGHILGSSMAHIHVGNGLHNLLYTGDLKYSRTRLLDRADNVFPRLESMIIESTYGSPKKVPPGRKETEQNFKNYVVNTVKDNGKVLVPVLGVGRAQEVMLMVHDLIQKGKIPKIPVYLDGMLWDVTAIHTAYPEFLNYHVRKQIFNDKNPFLADFFNRVGGNKERKEIINQEGPYIVLATSGMLVGGSSVQYFREFAENPKNSIVFVSYQAEGSLGRKVQEGRKEFVMLNDNRKKVNVRMRMNKYTLDGLSGHSNALEIKRFVNSCRPSPKKILVVHGEGSSPFELSGFLKAKTKADAYVPAALDSIRLV